MAVFCHGYIFTAIHTAAVLHCNTALSTTNYFATPHSRVNYSFFYVATQKTTLCFLCIKSTATTFVVDANVVDANVGDANCS